ncbi:hypothetical protein Z517_05571 [Fonsecaea pedrosoi CBS 271.37]|uniref:Uncharacterized protein n=1 Tax=Fonsecaea pedrosoi CBS 271.37 TaxID=1442368 RepID=A0A0D2HDL3_9EURO|nr:uncharacterized protein Z517_05571 [Fonsecaea pedrosoi CBS 271.37]KIW82544.1 hypothetical protein Z517_05571 [Fonsecaea pedrosoi CBS 271.37]
MDRNSKYHTSFIQNDFTGNAPNSDPNSQTSNPLNNVSHVQQHLMGTPNHAFQNSLARNNSLQPLVPMAQSSTDYGSPLRQQTMGLHIISPQMPNLNGSPLGSHQIQMPENILPSIENTGNGLGNIHPPTQNNLLGLSTEGTVGLHGEQMTNVVAPYSFNDAYFTDTNAMGMQDFLGPIDNSVQDFTANLFDQELAKLDPVSAHFQDLGHGNNQGNTFLPQGQRDDTTGQTQTQETVHILQAEIQTYKDKVSSLEQEHGTTVATLQQQISKLKTENAALGKDAIIATSYYNTLLGRYDFLIGPDGRLFPVIPRTMERAILASNRPKPPLQQNYEAKLQRLKQEYRDVLLRADICHLCPLHHSSRHQLRAPSVERAALQFIDLTNVDEEPVAVFRSDSIQDFLARAARDELAQSSSSDGQTMAVVHATTCAQKMATFAAIPPTMQAGSSSAGSTQPLAVETARPRPLDTPPSEMEDINLAKRQKRKQSDYGWMQPSQNLALRKANGDLPHPLEEWSLQQAGNTTTGFLDAVAVHNAATTTPAADRRSSIQKSKPAPAPKAASAAPKLSKVTKTKAATLKKPTTREKGKGKAKASAARSANLTTALTGLNSVTSATNISGSSSARETLTVDILPEEPAHVRPRTPSPPPRPTISTTDMDAEYETDEDMEAQLRDYDLTVIDHNEQYPLPEDNENPQATTFWEVDDGEVEDIIALLEEPQKQQAMHCPAKESEKDSAQGQANPAADFEQEVAEDNGGIGDASGDADLESLFNFDAVEEDLPMTTWPGEDEESEVSEEE